VITKVTGIAVRSRMLEKAKATVTETVGAKRLPLYTMSDAR
jgi:hypothetical protein